MDRLNKGNNKITYFLLVDRCMHLYLMPIHCICMPGICVRGIDFASFCKFTIGFSCDTFNNISAISWRWVLSVEEDGVRGKKNTDLPQVNDKLYHKMAYRVSFAMSAIRTHNVSGDWNRLHRQLYIKLPYDHDHHGFCLCMMRMYICNDLLKQSASHKLQFFFTFL